MEMGFHAVWAVFQPFTFSRTATLLDDFAKALSIPDHAVLTDIMGSREKNTYGIFTRNLGEKIPGAVWFPQDESDPNSNDTRKYENFEQVCNYICVHAQPGDLVFYRPGSAGDDNHVGIVVGVNDNGSLLVVHCSSGQNGVVTGEAGSSGFQYVRSPLNLE